jgi:hypothetical protein
LRIVNNHPSIPSAGLYALSAANAQVMVDIYIIFAAVIAKLRRAGSDAGMAVYALFFYNVYDF